MNGRRRGISMSAVIRRASWRRLAPQISNPRVEPTASTDGLDRLLCKDQFTEVFALSRGRRISYRVIH
jgi:hypothetical protein